MLDICAARQPAMAAGRRLMKGVAKRIEWREDLCSGALFAG